MSDSSDPSAFGYPLDVDALRNAAKSAGVATQLGIGDDARPDEVLTKLVWGLGQGWFPLYPDRTFHGAVDIGIPGASDASLPDTPVLAIADGEVHYAEAHAQSAEGYDFGRIVLRCERDGHDVYVLYQHLGDLSVVPGQWVNKGDRVGTVGWHGSFPHLHLAIASEGDIGGTDDLVPAVDQGAWPDGDGVWNVQRVRMPALDPNEWAGAPDGAYNLFNPIEFIRFTQGLEYQHDIGMCVPHGLDPAPTPVESTPTPGQDHDVSIERVLQSKALGGCDDLQKLAHDPQFAPIKKGDTGATVEALQRGFQVLQYDVGHFGPNHDGVDGDFGKTLERVVADFKANALPNVDLHPFADVKDASPDPVVDWITLLAIDSMVASMENTPQAAPPPPPDRASAPPSDEKRPDAAPAAGDGGGITIDQLCQIMPNLARTQAVLQKRIDRKKKQGKSTDILDGMMARSAYAEAALVFLNKAMIEFEINNDARRAAFLAQVAHESYELMYFEEEASGDAYNNRADLGNGPDDGPRYKGRGPIQLTGRTNYTKAQEELNATATDGTVLDIVNHPETVATNEVAFRTSAWFWKKNGLNELADANKFKHLTHIINGGHGHQDKRDAYFVTSRDVLGITKTDPPDCTIRKCDPNYKPPKKKKKS